MNEVPFDREHFNPVGFLLFFAAHAAAVVGVLLVGWSPDLLALAVLAYVVRMWALTAGYHRYFSHRAFKTSRWFQFVLAFVGACAAQKGVLWWAAHHRHHHRHSDQDQDIHSPTNTGFIWAHVGWVLSGKYMDTNYDKIKDFAKYPELRWLNRHHELVPLGMGALLWIVFGPAVFVWVGLVSTVALWHGTFTINSLAHLIGERRYPTNDTSKNSFALALITLGEGWHNNHHYYPGATRQGHYWWEIDLTFYSLKVLSWLGIVWDLNGVPERVLAKGRQSLAQAEAVTTP